MLETLELRFCVDVGCVYLVSPKLENLYILSSYKITKLCSVDVSDRLRQSLKLQSLEILFHNFILPLSFLVTLYIFNFGNSSLSHSPKLERMIIQQREKLSNPTNKEKVNC
ncbi:hypothetical protein H5410_027220 [Solanum commersonii]|uniref:Uncharacterized protein n=1 Tax=Solanum commersonii TaxID=4109 RepID=A0A9J5Z177_SOLCO|nr:hypothetical protein H5410_027220 [Solanum commersonii]